MTDRMQERYPSCGAPVEAGEPVASPSLEALEAQVPDAWVSAMWDDVQGALRTRPATSRSRRRWAVPVLTAAALALLLANGVTVRALRRSEARSVAMAEQLLDQQRRLVAAEPSASARSGGGVLLAGRDAWLRSLQERGDITVADLRSLLNELPANTPVMTTPRSSSLASARRVPAVWREALARLDTSGGVTTGDLVNALDAMDLPGSTSVPTARLIDLLS